MNHRTLIRNTVAVVGLLGASGLCLAADEQVAVAAPAPISGVEAGVIDHAEIVQDLTPYHMTDADRELTAKVMDLLASDHLLRGRIAVSAVNGEVVLTGKVKSVPMIYRAVEMARRVDNTHVINVNVDHLDRG